MNKNRSISLLLVLAVIVGMFAMTVPAGAEGTEEPSLRTSKTVTYNGDGTYTIDLQAYAEGVLVTTEVVKKLPCDIVMVLDTSGSMDEYMGNETVPVQRGGSYDGYDVSEGDLYYKWTDGEFYPIKLIRHQHNGLYDYRTWAYFDVGEERYYLYNREVIKAVDQSNPTYDGRNGSYPYRADNPSQKIDCHKEMGTNIFNSSDVYVYERYTKLEALKKASIQFINMVYEDAVQNEVDHKIAIIEFASDGYLEMNLTSVKNQDGTLNSKFETAIEDFVSGGSTASDYALGDAKSIFIGQKKTARDDSNHAVILFTDGAPTHGSTEDDFSRDREAIGVATAAIKRSKEIKDSGAEVYTVGCFVNETDSIKTYMNGVSSNYPNATEYDKLGEGSDRGYYMNARDCAGLADVFKIFAKEIITGSMTVQVTSKAVLTDIVSDSFYIPDGENSVKVYTADYDEASGTFKEEKEFTDADVDVTGNKVTITGFDYAAHWCGKQAPAGQKLIARVTIKPVDQSFDSDGDIYTNEEGSGVSEDGDKYDFPFEKPTVTPVKVTFKYKDGTGAEIADPTEEYYLPGTEVTKTLPAVEGYVPDETTQQFTVPDEDTEISLLYSVAPPDDDQDPDEYTITYDANGGSTVAPQTYTEMESITLAAAPTRKGYTFKGWVLEDSGTSNWETGTYEAEQTIFLGKYGDITLKADWTENTATITYAASVIGGEGGTVTLNSDKTKTGKTVSETVGAVTGTPGATAAPPSDCYEFLGWFTNADGTGVPVSTSESFAPTQSDGLYGTASYYAVFRQKTTSLTVEKKGMNKGESAIFKITGKGLENGLTVTVPGNGGKVTVSGLLAGEEYTVEELSWSWAYSGESTKKLTTDVDAAKNTLTFTNTAVGKVWLRAEATVKNVFGKKS